MTPADLERFILAETARAWADLLEMDRERGGTGQLQDTAISLTRNRMMISVHSNYHDDDRMLTSCLNCRNRCQVGRNRCQVLIMHSFWTCTNGSKAGNRRRNCLSLIR
jgi:hypothetical protein